METDLNRIRSQIKVETLEHRLCGFKLKFYFHLEHKMIDIALPSRGCTLYLPRYQGYLPLKSTYQVHLYTVLRHYGERESVISIHIIHNSFKYRYICAVYVFSNNNMEFKILSTELAELLNRETFFRPHLPPKPSQS